MNLEIVILTKSEKPIYEQIYDQIAAQILSGVLSADDCLPSIRTLAKELEISVITVKKAWERLEADDFIYTRAGKGCFVSAHPTAKLIDIKTELAQKQLEKDLPFYKNLGITKEELIELIRKSH